MLWSASKTAARERTSTGQPCNGLRSYPADQNLSRRTVTYQAHRLPNNDSSVLWIALDSRSLVLVCKLFLQLGVCEHLVLALPPVTDDTVRQRSDVEGPGPSQAAGNVWDAAAHRRITTGPQGHILQRCRYIGFGAGPESRAQQHTVGAQHQSGGQPTAIGNATSCQEQRVGAARRQKICGLGDKAHGAAHCAVPTSLGALRHNHSCTCLECLLHMDHALALADQWHPD
mmetsp:Transcript_74949/g.173806  ORF Transcript_74949/g.173806 Transcript_74949/m.173806 type:complete len:229 (-) Transcript_74949:431-1117(-)